jgi:hypothetical protein
MSKEEDRILECYLLQGQGIKWLGVVYLEGGRIPRALLRYPISDSQWAVYFLPGDSRQGLSEMLSGIFAELAEWKGSSAIQVEYPLGVAEKDFIEGMRQAKKLQEIRRPFLEN